uniref:Glycosyltransferase 2-like domain-containing protein n=1 Tax=mine drainage metagenome TaxID=410659 RepID=E6PV27_9ZZZZ
MLEEKSMTSTQADDDVLVSVVIPAHNAAATLAETLHSVLAQSYRHIEIVVVDDGSTDGTWDLLQSFGPAVRAIHQANAGLAAARNAGVAAASGTCIALHDADDLCEPECIAAQRRGLDALPQFARAAPISASSTAVGPSSPRTAPAITPAAMRASAGCARVTRKPPRLASTWTSRTRHCWCITARSMPNSHWVISFTRPR